MLTAHDYMAALPSVTTEFFEKLYTYRVKVMSRQ